MNHQQKLRSSFKWKILRFLWLIVPKIKRFLFCRISHVGLKWILAKKILPVFSKIDMKVRQKMIFLSSEANKKDIAAKS